MFFFFLFVILVVATLLQLIFVSIKPALVVCSYCFSLNVEFIIFMEQYQFPLLKRGVV